MLHQAHTVAYDDRIMTNLQRVQRVPMGDVFRLGQGTLTCLASSEEQCEEDGKQEGSHSEAYSVRASNDGQALAAKSRWP